MIALSHPAKVIVILQSNYIPWKGYFDLMAAADEFLIFDEAQYTKNDWRNRNKIVLEGRTHWLTIPVSTSGQLGERVDAMRIAKPGWAQSHWTTIAQAYRRAPYFNWAAPVLKDAFSAAGELTRLTEINELMLRAVAGLIDIRTPITRAGAIPRKTLGPTLRLVEICRATNATAYISGPSAKAYLDLKIFEDAGISLLYSNYAGYPEYDQSMVPFEHGVSMLDVLFRCGPEARNHLKSRTNIESFLQPP